MNTTRRPRAKPARRGPPRSLRLCGGAGALAAVVAAVLAGCASRPGVVFDPANAAWNWPPPPDAPRIWYVGQLAADADLKPGRSGRARLASALFGDEPARTMLSPLGVCTDGRDRVFIADSNAQLVHVFDLKTRRYARWRPPPSVGFSQPVAVAYDPRGRVLVSDAVEGTIAVFDAAGGWLGTMGDGHGLVRPCGLALDAARGRLFVADAGAHQVVVLSLDDEVLARVGGRGSGPGEFNFPTHVAVDGEGRLYVSDSLNFRVQVFDGNLEPVRRIGRKGDMPGYFSTPKGLGVDGMGHLYVVDANFEAVQVFDLEGRLLMTFGGEGHGPGQFWLPAGLFAEPGGRIWVADSYNRRVQVFQYREPWAAGKGDAP